MSDPTDTCVCGHVEDEHEDRVDKFPGRSLACLVEDCDCIHYEKDEKDDDDE